MNLKTQISLLRNYKNKYKLLLNSYMNLIHNHKEKQEGKR